MVLGIASALFALRGYHVYCASYLDKLSSRDKQEFKSIFEILGLSDRIKYGTYKDLCEEIINEETNLRTALCDFF